MEDLGLNVNNIIDDDEISSLLFSDVKEEDDSSNVEDNEKEVDDESDENENKEAAEVDPETLFESDETPENVGGNEQDKEKEDTQIPNNSGSSPDFFSSIATAFAEEGIFPDLDEETVKGIKDAKSFKDAINEQIEAGLTEQQKRVKECLEYGVEPTEIQKHERMLNYLYSLDDDVKNGEGEQFDNLRRNLIAQDYLNKGFSQEKTKKLVEKSFESGNEIEDAQEALDALKGYYAGSYNKLRMIAKQQAEEEVKEQNRRAETIRKTILESTTGIFGDIELSKKLRQDAYDAISKPIYKNPQTGEYYTALQKADYEDHTEFTAKLGLIYALTDGFKTLNNLIDTAAKKKVKKGFAELESKINNTSRDSLGNLNFASGSNDSNSYIGKGIKLDI